MPFLSFSPTSGMDRSENSLNGHSNSMSEMKKHRDSVSTKKAAVTFIPSQIDGLSATTSPHHRPAQTPSKLLFHDLLTLCHYFFTNALSMFSWNDGLLSARNIKSFLRDPLDVRDLICQCMLGFLEFWAIVLGIPATLFLPGLMSLFLAGCLIPVIWGLAWILNDGAGHRVVRCCRRGSSKERDRRMARECVENGLDFGDERWIFIHGIMTRFVNFHHNLKIYILPVLTELAVIKLYTLILPICHEFSAVQSLEFISLLTASSSISYHPSSYALSQAFQHQQQMLYMSKSAAPVWTPRLKKSY